MGFLGFVRKGDLEDLREDIIEDISKLLNEPLSDSNQLHPNLANPINKILKSNDPTDVAEQIELFRLKRDFINDMKQGRRMKLRHMKNKGEEEEDQPFDPAVPVPAASVEEGVKQLADKWKTIPKWQQMIGNTGLKSFTGYTVEDVIKNPSLAPEIIDKLQDKMPQLAEMFKGMIPEKVKEKVEGKPQVKGLHPTGREVDINDPQGYPLRY